MSLGIMFLFCIIVINNKKYNAQSKGIGIIKRNILVEPHWTLSKSIKKLNKYILHNIGPLPMLLLTL